MLSKSIEGGHGQSCNGLAIIANNQRAHKLTELTMVQQVKLLQAKLFKAESDCVPFHVSFETNLHRQSLKNGSVPLQKRAGAAKRKPSASIQPNYKVGAPVPACPHA